jgi:hypothetical protein
MTKSDVVDAFIRGDLDRRGFIKRLTAVGVSSAAAMAYAGSLVQSTAAAPSTGSGFITRGYMQDADYGLAVAIENVPEAIQALLATIQERASAIQNLLGDFDGDDFADAGLDEADREVLADIQGQIVEQAQAIAAFRGLPLAEATETAVEAVSGLIEALTAVAEGLNEAAGEYAALIPALEDPLERELFSQIAIAAGRHAAIVSYLAGLDPVPGAFEAPIDPVE